MSENLGRESRVALGDDEFEKRLFAMIDTGDLHFPKGVVRPGDQAAPRGGLVASFRDRLARLVPRFPRLFLTAAVAYGLALVVSLPTYLVLFPTRSAPAPSAVVSVEAPEQVEPPLGSAAVLGLGAGATRAAGAAPVLRVRASDAYVVLSFLAPIRSGAGLVHQATITDAAGRIVAAQKPIRAVDELGNFVLVCRAALFSSGEYELALAEVPALPSAPGESHRFSFRVTRPGP
jgi:hypothetical protein